MVRAIEALETLVKRLNEEREKWDPGSVTPPKTYSGSVQAIFISGVYAGYTNCIHAAEMALEKAADEWSRSPEASPEADTDTEIRKLKNALALTARDASEAIMRRDFAGYVALVTEQNRLIECLGELEREKAEASSPAKKRAELEEKLQDAKDALFRTAREAAEASDRRDWDGCDKLAAEERRLEEQIAALESQLGIANRGIEPLEGEEARR